ncbi:MAG: helix-turn-helix domain-containing protein [Oscillospiraceae bacterium]|nr:helix-turn-helix domain-containing protein [Oscillospiraceae bacterium]
MYKKLRELREFHGLRQDEVAQVLNITRAAYSAYEINKRQMSHEALCILADFYHVTVDFILGRSNKNLFLFSENEQKFIEKFRTLDEHGKCVVLTLLDLESSRKKHK